MTLPRAVFSTVLLFGLGCGFPTPQSRESSQPAPCPTAQPSTGVVLPAIEPGRAGRPWVFLVLSPMRDTCLDSRPAVSVTAVDDVGAPVSGAAALDTHPQTYLKEVLVARVQLQPTRGGWHIVTVDFHDFGGKVELRAFAAEPAEVSQTLPYSCLRLARGASGWLCDDAFVRGVTTVRQFSTSGVELEEDAIWVYDHAAGKLRRFTDSGSGDLVEDPINPATVAKFSSYAPPMFAARDDVAVLFSGRLDFYRATATGILLATSHATPLLDGASAVFRSGDWFYVIRGKSAVCPIRLDRQSWTTQAINCFDVDGEVHAVLPPSDLVLRTKGTEEHLMRIIALRDGVAQPSSDPLELPKRLTPDPGIKAQSLWEWYGGLNQPTRVFALRRTTTKLELVELPVQRNSSDYYVWPAVRPGMGYWLEGASTKIVQLP